MMDNNNNNRVMMMMMKPNNPNTNNDVVVNDNDEKYHQCSYQQQQHQQQPHLILYVDINKTMIMLDPIQGKDVQNVLNDIIAEHTYGRIDHDSNEWIPVTDTIEKEEEENGSSTITTTITTTTTITPSATVDGDDNSSTNTLISYANYLRSRYSSSNVELSSEQRKENKKIRKELRRTFTTNPSSIGYYRKQDYDRLEQCLQIQEQIQDDDDHDPSSPDDEENSMNHDHCEKDFVVVEKKTNNSIIKKYHFILPSFFYLIEFLEKNQRSYNIILRTFGEDIHHVANEWNQFCCGKHILFPHIKLDGSLPNTINRRLYTTTTTIPKSSMMIKKKNGFSMGVGLGIGTFYRTDTSTSLIVGTLEQPSDDIRRQQKDMTTHENGLEFYESIRTKQTIATSTTTTTKVATDTDTSFSPSCVENDDSETIEIITGYSNIYKRLQILYQQYPTFAIRDDYYHWSTHAEAATAGKLFLIDSDGQKQKQKQIPNNDRNNNNNNNSDDDDNNSHNDDDQNQQQQQQDQQSAGTHDHIVHENGTNHHLSSRPAVVSSLLMQQPPVVLEFFLDDNILGHDPHIVDARDIGTGSVIPFPFTKDTYLLRVEPYYAIRDQDYFIKLVTSAE